jgi:hypothetical protein
LRFSAPDVVLMSMVSRDGNFDEVGFLGLGKSSPAPDHVRGHPAGSSTHDINWTAVSQILLPVTMANARQSSLRARARAPDPEDQALRT